MKYKLLLGATFSIVLARVAIWFDSDYEAPLKWDWSQIQPSELPQSFPSDFLWGTATAAHQVEGGCTNNQWSRWENKKIHNSKPTIKTNETSGEACRHWDLYKADIELVKSLHLDVFRLSLEWSKLEPRQGEFDDSALLHYHDVLDALAQANIKASVTLFHFTLPIWFVAKGAFEKRENVLDFQQFAVRMFAEYHSKVFQWATMNEPQVFVLMGYVLGEFPPGDTILTGKATIVSENLALAHVGAYRAMKGMPGGGQAQIGIVKNIIQFDAMSRYNPVDRAICWFLDRFFNDALMEYLVTGEFNASFPFLGSTSHSKRDAIGATDFIGLNYYSHVLVNSLNLLVGNLEESYWEDDIRTDMRYAVYAEGFYRALKYMDKYSTKLRVPIYVTENGVADEKDNIRSLWVQRYIYALSKAMQEGCDVRGFYYWSLMDNFEWCEGYSMKFGLYEVDFSSQERTFRKGSDTFRDIVTRFKNK